MRYYAWNATTKTLSIFDRETGRALYITEDLNSFEAAKTLGDAFGEIYQQGLREGKRSSAARMDQVVEDIRNSI